MRKKRSPKPSEIAVVFLGLAVFVFFARSFDSAELLPAAFLACCIVLAEFIDVHLPQGEPVSVSSAFLLFSLLTFKLPQVIVIGGISLLVAAVVKLREANALAVLRPVAVVSLEVLVAAFAFNWLGGKAGVIDLQGSDWLPLVGVSLAYFGSKIILEHLLTGNSRKLTHFPSLAGTLGLLGPTYLALACTGILMALMYKMMYFWGILLFFLPLLVTRHSFKLYMDIKQTYQSTISALAAAIEAQDPRRTGHAKRVARNSVAIGRELGLRGRHLEVLGYAAFLHDIGKLGTEESDLDLFFEEQRLGLGDGEAVHAIKGAEILEEVDYLKGISDVVRKHHTPYSVSRNGNGIRIPLAARIINVASYYDDLTHMQEEGHCAPRQAVDKIKTEQGTRFDPKVVRAFTGVLRRQGKLVILF